MNTIVTLTSLITMVKTRALAIGMSWRHLVNMMVYRYELAPPDEYKCTSALAVPLCHIFDFSFKNGVLPVCWKTAYVLPTYIKRVVLVIHVIIDQFH